MYPDGEQPHRATYRFVQASDLQLDVPIRGISAPPAPLRAALRDATLRAWQSLVELALERDAAFVILAGGLFGAATPAVRTCVALHDGIERLRSRAIDVCIALDGDDLTAAAQLPWLVRRVTLFAPDELGATRIVRDGCCLATVHGMSGDGRDAKRIVRDLRRLGPEPAIGVLPRAPAALDGDFPASAGTLLASGGLDYWALGGSPVAAVLRDEPWIVCAGTPQGRGLEAQHVGAKGCMVVDVADGRIVSVGAVALDHVRFLRLDLEVGGCADVAALRRLLFRELERGSAEAGDRIIAVEATLRGQKPSGDMARDRLGFEAELLSQLRRESAARGMPVWWVRVRDLTARDDRSLGDVPWELRRIVTEQSEALSAPLPGSTFLARTFAPLLRQWDAETDLAAQRELVRDAATLAHDALDSERRS